ncbi:GATA-domain-containing protein [Auriculariales sp. MPI-PUGE-AT-0066]|nr:GATA-domain-containing protein [Auriculariales sp. MPI-PUGE-AT-0066]
MSKKKEERKEESPLKFENKKMYRDILVKEQPGCWTVILDKNGKVLFTSRFVVEALGLPESKVVDRNIREYMHEMDVPAFEKSLGDLLSKHVDVECNLRFKHNTTQTFRFIELRVTPYFKESTRDLVDFVVASGRLTPSLVTDVYQSLIDAKLENEMLNKALQSQDPLAASSPTSETSVWDQGGLGTSRYDPSAAPIPAFMPPGAGIGSTPAYPPSQPTAAKSRSPRKRYAYFSADPLKCGTTTSPEWRKGPNRSKELCNACGLRFAKGTKEKDKGTQQETAVGDSSRG